MNRKLYYLIGGLLVAVLATAITFAVVNIYLPKDPENGLLNGVSNEHEAITILGDMDFEDYDFLGNGTENNPYIIENYNITTTEDHAIYIKFTTKYFIIRNCTLSAINYGVYLGNITYGTSKIILNNCNNHLYSGIFLTDSSGSTIINNICNNNSDGITLEESSNVYLINNNCDKNNGFGIYLDYSNNASLTNNTCSNNHDGIKSYHSSNATLINNTCNDNDHRGINLESAHNMTLVSNSCYRNNHGISIDFSSNLTFINNTCNNNNLGVFIGVSSITTLINNTCNNNNEYGIWLDYNSDNATLINNTLNSNACGLLIWRCNYCFIGFNYFSENSDYAISISSLSENNTIHHNSFIDNNPGGTSQATDDGSNNIWFDNITDEGNYWSDWIGVGDYDIDGSALVVDPYPLSSPPVACYCRPLSF